MYFLNLVYILFHNTSKVLYCMQGNKIIKEKKKSLFKIHIFIVYPAPCVEGTIISLILQCGI